MTFSLDLSKAIERAKGRTDLVIKKVMLETFSKVVQKSPVSTGRLRANWTTSIGNYSKAPTASLDLSGSATIGKIAADISTMKIGGQTIFLTNALPYAHRIEYEGWSKQAPAGMVRTTLAEISAKYGA